MDQAAKKYQFPLQRVRGRPWRTGEPRDEGVLRWWCGFYQWPPYNLGLGFMLAGLKKINTKYRDMGGMVWGKRRTHSFVEVGGTGLNGIFHLWGVIGIVLGIGVFGLRAVGHFGNLLLSNVEYGIWNMGLAMYNGGVGNLLVFGDVAIVICLDGSTSSSWLFMTFCRSPAWNSPLNRECCLN